MARGQDTKSRILDIARESVLAKGFDATSIDEIVAAAEITKGGFFYHFQDKTALAVALLEDYIEEEDHLIGGLITRAKDLSDDPLQVMLIALKLFAEQLEDMPRGHPGCLIATAAYQDRLFDSNVWNMNRTAILTWRARFRELLDDIVAQYPPQDSVDLDDLSDHVMTVIEGGIVMAKGLREPLVTSRQVMMLRSYLKLLFRS